MDLTWHRHDQQQVIEALRQGERPDMATTQASGRLDELVGLHQQLGVFDVLDGVSVERKRAGVDDRLLLRTLSVLPFLEAGSLSGAAGQLFGEPAVLLHLGWIQAADRRFGPHPHRPTIASRPDGTRRGRARGSPPTAFAAYKTAIAANSGQPRRWFALTVATRFCPSSN